MLTDLATVKARLAIDDISVQYDDLLTFAIEAISARFAQEANRAFARTAGATFEFDADDLEICVPYYPVESISNFETKVSESTGWVEQSGIDYAVRRNCIFPL